MVQDMVTADDPYNLKTGPLQHSNNFTTADAGQTGHGLNGPKR